MWRSSKIDCSLKLILIILTSFPEIRNCKLSLCFRLANELEQEPHCASRNHHHSGGYSAISNPIGTKENSLTVHGSFPKIGRPQIYTSIKL